MPLDEVPPDPAEWTTLWRHGEALPDPYDDAAGEVVDRLLSGLDPDEASRLRLELERAVAVLDRQEVAEHVQPYPWQGPDRPFSARRFGLARERAVLRGREFVEELQTRPAAIGVVDTGPELSPRRRVLGHTPPPLAVLLGAPPASDAGGYPAPGSDPAGWSEPPGQADLHGTDPETVPFSVYPQVDDDALLARLRELPCALTPDQLQAATEENLRTEAIPDDEIEAWQEAGEVPAGYDDEDFAAVGAPLVVATAYAGVDAALRIWEATGRPHRVDDRVGRMFLEVVLDRRWSGGGRQVDAIGLGGLRVRVHVDALAAMSLEQLTDVLTAVAASVLADDLGRRHALREPLRTVADRYAHALPADAQAALQPA